MKRKSVARAIDRPENAATTDPGGSAEAGCPGLRHLVDGGVSCGETYLTLRYPIIPSAV